MRRRDVTTTETTGTFIHTIETAAYLQRCSHFVCYPLSPFTFVRSPLARSLSLSLPKSSQGWLAFLAFSHIEHFLCFSPYMYVCLYMHILYMYIRVLHECIQMGIIDSIY